MILKAMQFLQALQLHVTKNNPQIFRTQEYLYRMKLAENIHVLKNCNNETSLEQVP